MSLTNPNTPVSQQDLQDFYHKILPYMGGSSGGGGGHTIEDAEGTDLTQRDTMQFGTGFKATDDSENEKTVVEADVMQSGDMDDIVTPLPSVQPNLPVLYDDSETERVVGYALVNGIKKKVYEKEVDFGALPNNTSKEVNHNISNLGKILYVFGYSSTGVNTIPVPYASHSSIGACVNIYVNATQIVIACGVDRSSYTNTVITLRYTKIAE